jgi:regulator of replication initiation timing
MFNKEKLNTKLNKKRKISSLLPTLAVLLIMSFFVVQLIVLTSIGTQGEKVKTIRDSQTELKIENEILRARIYEMQSTQEIRKTANEELQMKPVDVQYLDLDQLQITAQK